MPQKHQIGWPTATALVISNMIGTGVFTSVGFQLQSIQHWGSLLLLWVLGGLLALIGAFSLAELGTHYRRSGGDYVFISRGFHPFWGYLSAWTSLVAGFAAPVAIAALAMEAYLSFLDWPYLRFISVLVVIGISFFHSFNVRQSGIFQNISTIFKLLFVIFLLWMGWYFPAAQPSALLTDTSFWTEITSTGFAVSLLYVTYAYTGWNAAAYIVEEVREPAQDLPKALVGGTLLVMTLYVLLQAVFLRLASLPQLEGQAEVALIASQNVLGTASRWVSLGIAVQLIATMSSYVWIGPRVTQAMAQDHHRWAWLRATNAGGVPVRATWLQCGITLVLLLSGSLQQVLLYTSFLLQLMGTLAVASLLKTQRQPQDFQSPGRPYLQYAYVGFNLVVLCFIAWDKPLETGIGLGILAVGALSYGFRQAG